MPPVTYRISTLGCRVNHAEAREMESVLLRAGLRRAEAAAPADLEVIHTCSVTRTAARKSRHAVRRARKSSTDRYPTQILIAGCYAATDTVEAGRLARSDLNVIPQDAGDGSTMIDRFTQRVKALLSSRVGIEHRLRSIRRPHGSGSDAAHERTRGVLPLPLVPAAPEAGNHIRAELKIQDGCDAHCTFCIIPKIRRTLRSKRIHDAVAEARRLVDLGHREIVLTGIFIGAYGHETALRRKQRDPHVEHLAELIDALAQIEGLERLRISSMEPGDVTETLLDAMVANAPIVVPHLHLPLQSGSDRILRRMNRQYRVGEYLEMIALVEEALTTPDGLPPAITTDIICGFPGETDHDFARTIEVVERVQYLHMHVFPFSPRAGTAAARWTDQFVPDTVKKGLVRTLIDLEHDPIDGLSIRFRRKLHGRTARVLIEQPDADDPHLMTGRCDHYALVHIPTSRPHGSIVNVTIDEVTPTHTLGIIAQQSLPLPVLH